MIAAAAAGGSGAGRSDAGGEGLDNLRGCQLPESVSAKNAKSTYLLAFFVNAIDLWAVVPGATAKVAKGLLLAFLGGSCPRADGVDQTSGPSLGIEACGYSEHGKFREAGAPHAGGCCAGIWVQCSRPFTIQYPISAPTFAGRLVPFFRQEHRPQPGDRLHTACGQENSSPLPPLRPQHLPRRL